MVTPLSADQTVRKSILKAGQIRRKQLLRLHLKWLNADLNSISAPADLCFQDASWRCTSPDGSSVRSPHHTFHAFHYLPAENGCGCCPGRRAGPAHWYPTHNGQENNPAVREIKKKKWQKLKQKTNKQNKSNQTIGIKSKWSVPQEGPEHPCCELLPTLPLQSPQYDPLRNCCSGRSPWLPVQRASSLLRGFHLWWSMPLCAS